MDITIACVLKTGGDFNAKHVIALSKQVKNLVCFSDIDIAGVTTIPLKYDYAGWWSKMEIFRDDIKGDIFFIDLDTVIVGDISDMLEVGKTTMLKDFYHERLASGLMYITESDRWKVWNKWIKNPQSHIVRCGSFGDQKFISEVLHDAEKWQELFKERVISYKAHYLKDPKTLNNASIVCFHGKPRPWQVNHKWLPNY